MTMQIESTIRTMVPLVMIGMTMQMAMAVGMRIVDESAMTTATMVAIVMIGLTIPIAMTRTTRMTAMTNRTTQTGRQRRRQWR